jgi:hypothetical protein
MGLKILSLYKSDSCIRKHLHNFITTELAASQVIPFLACYLKYYQQLPPIEDQNTLLAEVS